MFLAATLALLSYVVPTVAALAAKGNWNEWSRAYYQIVTQQGLAEVVWPGRLELVSQAPVVVLDGAHNPSAAQALRATVEELWPQRAVHFLIGMSRDKLVEAVGQILGPLSASVTCAKSRHPRALNPETLAERLKPFCCLIHVVPDPLDAYTYLLNTVNAQDVLVVTGSLFLVRDIRTALRQAHITPRRTAAPA